jgi:hypothetical protein
LKVKLPKRVILKRTKSPKEINYIVINLWGSNPETIISLIGAGQSS